MFFYYGWTTYNPGCEGNFHIIVFYFQFPTHYNIWWPLGLFIVMNVNCSHGEKNSYANLSFQHFGWCPPC
jgi:hypothetical protein